MRKIQHNKEKTKINVGQICLQRVSSQALIMIILLYCSVWKAVFRLSLWNTWLWETVVSRGRTGELTVDPQTSHWGAHSNLWFSTTRHQNVSCTTSRSQKWLKATLQGSNLGWATAGRWNPRARISPEPYAAQFTLASLGEIFFPTCLVYFKWVYVHSMSFCITLHWAVQTRAS